MTRHHLIWANKTVNLAAIVMACLIVACLMPSDYNGGGGAVAFAVLVTAFIFRLVFQFLVNRAHAKQDHPK